MSAASDLVAALKAELRAVNKSYASLAMQLGMVESSVKRMFSRAGDMPLSRIDEICRVLGTDFADLARRVADAQPLLLERTAEQQQTVLADRRFCWWRPAA